MEDLCLAGMKVDMIGSGHIFKMATIPIYAKSPLKISRTISQMTLKLGTKQNRLEPYKIYINDPGLTLMYFTRSTLFI